MLIPKSRSNILLVTDQTDDYLINEDTDSKASIRLKRFRPLTNYYKSSALAGQIRPRKMFSWIGGVVSVIGDYNRSQQHIDDNNVCQHEFLTNVRKLTHSCNILIFWNGKKLFIRPLVLVLMARRIKRREAAYERAEKQVLETVSDGLRKIYKQKLLPLEEYYKFHDFHSPALDDPDFDAKPMILLVGQYSTGKTTFIRYLLEEDFPGIRIGPEPTTDRFIAVMWGEDVGSIPGNALVVDSKKQYRALSRFRNAFLNRFQCSTLNNEVLKSVTIVDTPGILSGEKQRIDRGYDFTGVLEWFAERVDRIILLFDAHKLDISDEFKRCIEALSGNEDKIRIVLNKSDMVDHQQLMRVYGALMWSLGKVFKTPEVSRVYIGTFWDHPLHYDINRRLFQDEQHDLFSDLQALPRNAALRKLNDLIKRARLAKAWYISHSLFTGISIELREHNISAGDFPDINKMREHLPDYDFTKFNPIKPKLLEVVDGMLASDIARLMAQIPKEENAPITNGLPQPHQTEVRGGAFDQAIESETPFGFGKGEGFDKGANESGWVVARERYKADEIFDSLDPIDGKITGRAAKEHMVKSKLPNAILGKIWKLSDVDKDGMLDSDEFALANYLINLKLEGHELPTELPKHLIPPSKRDEDPIYPTLDS
ncbi:EH domain-containing protein 1 [Dirofilaria immitis]|nr:EH domain-containing protein 1 [Dirofilaria immitis]